VYCIQNHDQVGNRALGTRLSHDVALDAYAAVSMLLLFLPMTPLLFMGQEWAATAPFLFFTDHEAALGEQVSRGRREEFKHFAAFQDPSRRAAIPDPQAATTFERSKLAWGERGEPTHARVLDLYRAMLALRRNDPVLASPSRASLACTAEGSILRVVRSRGGESRVLAVSFDGAPLPFGPGAGARCLLSSSPGGWADGVLAPWGAALFTRAL
jgi:maltooligosyltrehalose trehalohydrolase